MSYYQLHSQSLAKGLNDNSSKLCSADTVGLLLAARDIVADSVLNILKSEKRDDITLNIATNNLEARVKALEERAHYNFQCINYLSEEVMQLKINSTKAELDKAERVLKLLGIETFYKGSSRDDARCAIGEWINEKLGGSIHRYKCISIVPVLPSGSAKFNPYAILRFIDVTDARFFEHILFSCKKTEPSMKDVRMVRWSISSSDLSAGTDKDFIYAIQEQIADFYNDHITKDTLDSSFVLKDFQVKMIKITPTKVSYKDDTHVCLEFIDPCDGVTQMYFKPGNDPFANHDFRQPIPNPTTRTRAETDAMYKQCTLKDSEMWKLDKPKWMK